MKRKKILCFGLASVLCLLFAFAFGACSADEMAGRDIPDFVRSIELQFNHEKIEDSSVTIGLDSSGNCFNAVVDSVGIASRVTEFDSSNIDVAVIADDGNVTVIGPGETVVTATVRGSKSLSVSVLLVVRDNSSESDSVSHSINVEGGEADCETAFAGQTVTLKAYVEEGRHFTGWKFDNRNISANGNEFVMPDEDVYVTAVYEDIVSE